MIYEPEEPYIFKNGQKQGKAVEILMFQDFFYLDRLYKKMEENYRGLQGKNELHKHLEWIMARTREVKPIKLCRFCQERPIAYISIRRSKSGTVISHHFACCNDPACSKKLSAELGSGNPQLVPANLFSLRLRIFNKTWKRRQFLGLLRFIYGLEGRLTAQKAFEFFKNSNPSSH